MKFKTEIVPWINEIKSYIKGDSNKIGQLKKILREVDFEKLDYATKARLTNLFDPRCEITEEVFKRELNLYFSLLEDKKPINIPIFSEFIEWVYAQDVSTMSDSVFEIISSRLLKTTAENLPKSIDSFTSKLPAEYTRSIDRLSNERISTLISILNDMKLDYKDLPEECQGFIKNMFKACAVKTEISDKNKTSIRGLFKEDSRTYYSLFNKAFAGVSAYDSWIDEPAKKITYDRMIDYANFQEKVLENKRYGLSYPTFESCAKQLRLPLFPDLESDYNHKFYLSKPREYKDYAKKMGDLFVEMVQDEVVKFGENIQDNKILNGKFYQFAPTNKMKANIDRNISGRRYSSKEEMLRAYSDFLVGLVHLDELTGQSSRDIFKPNMPKIEPETKKKTETADKQLRIDDFDRYSNGRTYLHELDLDERIMNRCCAPDDLSLLYEMREEAIRNGSSTYDIEQAIFDLECRIDEEERDEALEKD